MQLEKQKKRKNPSKVACKPKYSHSIDSQFDNDDSNDKNILSSLIIIKMRLVKGSKRKEEKIKWLKIFLTLLMLNNLSPLFNCNHLSTNQHHMFIYIIQQTSHLWNHLLTINYHLSGMIISQTNLQVIQHNLHLQTILLLQKRARYLIGIS